MFYSKLARVSTLELATEDGLRLRGICKKRHLSAPAAFGFLIDEQVSSKEGVCFTEHVSHGVDTGGWMHLAWRLQVPSAPAFGHLLTFSVSFPILTGYC